MIAEPYICINGRMAGEIEWLDTQFSSAYLVGKFPKTKWQLYADFEREKLKELKSMSLAVSFDIDLGYAIVAEKNGREIYWSHCELEPGYDYEAYANDSEFSRLLRRAEFLKAVCEKEGVEWLPKPFATGGLVNENVPARLGHPCCIVRHQLIPVPERDYYTKAEIDSRMMHVWHLFMALTRSRWIWGRRLLRLDVFRFRDRFLPPLREDC